MSAVSPVMLALYPAAPYLIWHCLSESSAEECLLSGHIHCCWLMVTLTLLLSVCVLGRNPFGQ